MVQNALIVFLGCGLGGVLRYLVSDLSRKINPLFNFPLGTFIVNLTGCLLIGIFLALCEQKGIMSDRTRLFLTTGLCGGFTTFSSFISEIYGLNASEMMVSSLAYVAGSLIIGYLFFYGGYSLTRLLIH